MFAGLRELEVGGRRRIIETMKIGISCIRARSPEKKITTKGERPATRVGADRAARSGSALVIWSDRGWRWHHRRYKGEAMFAVLWPASAQDDPGGKVIVGSSSTSGQGSSRDLRPVH